MKNNMFKSATFAILSAFVLAMPSTTQGMVSLPKPTSPMFKSNFGFLQGLFGEENSMILSELWSHSSQVEEIVVQLIKDSIRDTNWIPVDPANPKDAQAQNWETFNSILLQNLINGPSQTIDELWNHSQKHIFSINAESAQQSAQAGQFGRGNISSKIARNTILVLKTNDARKTAIEFFIKSKPILKKEGNDIAFVSSFNFPLPLDICEYFIFVEGPKRTPLIDGIPHIVPLEIAETSIFNGILKLTCWNGGKIAQNPGTMFFRMNQFLTSYHESLEQQTYVAALLGMNKFIETSLETIPASEEKNKLLLGILSRLTSMNSLVSRKCRGNIELTKKYCKKI